jgi:hypothetical protein
VGRHGRGWDWAAIGVAFLVGVGVGGLLLLVVLYELVAWAARQP